MSVAGARERKEIKQSSRKIQPVRTYIKLVPPFSDDSAPSDEAARGLNGASPASSSLPLPGIIVTGRSSGDISSGRFAFAVPRRRHCSSLLFGEAYHPAYSSIIGKDFPLCQREIKTPCRWNTRLQNRGGPSPPPPSPIETQRPSAHKALFPSPPPSPSSSSSSSVVGRSGG